MRGKLLSPIFIILLFDLLEQITGLTKFNPYCRTGAQNGEILNLHQDETVYVRLEELIDGYNMTYRIEEPGDSLKIQSPTQPIGIEGTNSFLGDIVDSDSFLTTGHSMFNALLTFEEPVQDGESGIYHLYFDSTETFYEKAPSFQTPAYSFQQSNTEQGFELNCYTVTILSGAHLAFGCNGFNLTTPNKIGNAIGLITLDFTGKFKDDDIFWFDNFDPTWQQAQMMKAQRLYDVSETFGVFNQFYIVIGYIGLGITKKDRTDTNRNNSLYIYDIDFSENTPQILFQKQYIPSSQIITNPNDFDFLDFVASNNILYILNGDMVIATTVQQLPGEELQFSQESFFKFEYSAGTIGVFEDRQRVYIALVGYGLIQEYDWTYRSSGESNPRKLNFYTSYLILQGTKRIFFTPLYLAVRSPSSVLIIERGQTDYRDITHVIDFQDTNYDFYLFENDFAVSFDEQKSSLFWVYPPHLEISNPQSYRNIQVQGISSNGQETLTCLANLIINSVTKDQTKIYETSQNHNLTKALYPDAPFFIDLDVFYQGYNLSYALDTSSIQKESSSEYDFVGESKAPITFDGEFDIESIVFLESHDASTFVSAGFYVFSQHKNSPTDYQILVQKCDIYSFYQPKDASVQCTLLQKLTEPTTSEITQMAYGIVDGQYLFGFIYGTLQTTGGAANFYLYNLNDDFKYGSLPLEDPSLLAVATDVDIIGDQIYFTHPYLQTIVFYQVFGNGTMLYPNSLGENVVLAWALDNAFYDFWTPYQLHVNEKASDLFYIECLNGLFLVGIADNQAYYLSYIPLQSNLTDDTNNWSRLLTVEPTRVFLIELTASGSGNISQYETLNPYFPKRTKNIDLNGFEFYHPIVGSFSKQTFTNIHNFVYILGKDGGQYNILSYQAGQPKVNVVSFSPKFPFIAGANAPHLTAATSVSVDFVLALQKKGSQKVTEMWILPHVPYMLINPSISSQFADYVALDSLKIRANSSKNDMDGVINLEIAIVNSQNSIFISETDNKQNNVLGKISKESSVISFSDEGWITGNFIGYETVSSPNFQVKNKISEQQKLFNFTNVQAVSNFNTLYLALSQDCNFMIWDDATQQSTTVTSKDPEATCLSDIEFYSSTSETLYTYFISQKANGLSFSHHLYVMKWNVNPTSPDYLKNTVVYNGNELEQLVYFPGQITAYRADYLFVLDNDAINLGVNAGTLNLYKLNLTNPSAQDPIFLFQTYQQGAGECGIPNTFNIISFQVTDLESRAYVSILDGFGLGLQFFPLDSEFSCDKSDGVTISQLFGQQSIYIPEKLQFFSIHVLKVTTLSKDLKRADLLLASRTAAMYQFYITFDPQFGEITSSNMTTIYNHYGSSDTLNDLKIAGNNFAVQYFNSSTKAFVIGLYEIINLPAPASVQVANSESPVKKTKSQNNLQLSTDVPLKTMVAGVKIQNEKVNGSLFNAFVLYLNNGQVQIGSINNQNNQFTAYDYNQNLTLYIQSNTQNEFTQTVTFKPITDYGSNDQVVIKILQVEPQDDDSVDLLWLWILLALIGGVLLILVIIWCVKQNKQDRHSSDSTDYHQAPLVKEDAQEDA